MNGASLFEALNIDKRVKEGDSLQIIAIITKK